jgi:hypothetical protein
MTMTDIAQEAAKRIMRSITVKEPAIRDALYTLFYAAAIEALHLNREDEGGSPDDSGEWGTYEPWQLHGYNADYLNDWEGR